MLVDISLTAVEPQRTTPQLLFGHMSTVRSLARLSYEGVLGSGERGRSISSILRATAASAIDSFRV